MRQLQLQVPRGKGLEGFGVMMGDEDHEDEDDEIKDGDIEDDDNNDDADNEDVLTSLLFSTMTAPFDRVIGKTLTCKLSSQIRSCRSICQRSMIPA